MLNINNQVTNIGTIEFHDASACFNLYLLLVIHTY